MSRSVLIVAMLFFSQILVGQSTYIHMIRNYTSSLVLTQNEDVFDQQVSSEYGRNDLSVTYSLGHNYSFQGQEYDEDLGIYYFPNRLYDVKRQRFMQLDPKSQYFSPYSYVGGDPVNIVDRDGKQGKPLVLYQEELSPKGTVGNVVEDLKQTVPNADYMPMSKFINGEVGDITEFNGNVYIVGHMDQQMFKDFPVEDIPKGAEFKTKKLAGTSVEEGEKYASMEINGDEFAKRLVQFSNEKGVPLKNIVIGGCEGRGGAYSIHRGIMRMRSTQGEEVNVYGLRSGKYATWSGPNSFVEKRLPHGWKGPESARFYALPKEGYHYEYQSDRSVPGVRRVAGYKFTDARGQAVEMPQLTQPAEIEAMMNGNLGRVESQFERAIARY